MKSLCESSGLEGVAPYFGITPDEIEECRRARKKYKAEMARNFTSIGEYLESFQKKPAGDWKEGKVGDTCPQLS